MLNTDERVLKLVRNTVVADALFLGTVLSGYSQNIVSGNLQTVPTRTAPTEAKVTFTNTSNGNKYAQRTRDGTFSINLPTGTYQRDVEAVGNYLIEDIVSVNGNVVMSEKLMEDKPLTSQLYLNDGRSLLFLFKSLTDTQEDNPVNQTFTRSRDSPLRINPRNYVATDPLSVPQGIRPYLDTILLDYRNKTGNLLVFTEENVDAVRVQFQYPTTAEMPQPAFGYTEFDYDLTNIWINRTMLINYMNTSQHKQITGIFARELWRATNLATNSADPDMVSCHDGPTLTGVRLHPDEAEVLKRAFTMDRGTVMTKYRDIVVQSITNVLPQTITFSAPANNSIVTYVNDNLVVNYNAINPRDGDGETQSVRIRIRGNGIDEYITDTNTDGVILVAKSLFQAQKQYTLEGMTISGFDNVVATNIITFNTPAEANVAPTAPNLLLPASNAILPPNQSNTFRWNKSFDVDPVNYTLNIFGSGLNLVYNTSTDTMFVLPANVLIQNKAYSWKVTATDGTLNTESATRNLSMSNIPPGAVTLYIPSNGTIVAPDQSNLFRWSKSKDDDPITYLLSITGSGSNLAFDNLTDTLFTVPSNTLKQNVTYTWKVTASDDIANTESATRDISVSNLAPGAFALVTPANNSTLPPAQSNTFRWRKSQDDDPIIYELHIDGNSQNLLYDNITDTLFALSANILAQNKSYSWYVKAKDGRTSTNSNTLQFIVENTIAGAVTLYTPESNAVLPPNQSNTFKWSKSDETGIVYALNISGNGLNLVYDNLTDTLFALPANMLIQNKAYSWKVTLKDNGTNVDSNTRNFSMSNLAPGAFALVTPANNSTLPPAQSNTFRWRKSQDDDSIIYELHIDGNSQNLLFDNITDTVYALPANRLLQNQSYSWYVKAKDGQTSTSSNTLQLVADNIAPGAFSITSHKSGVTTEVSIRER